MERSITRTQIIEKVSHTIDYLKNIHPNYIPTNDVISNIFNVWERVNLLISLFYWNELLKLFPQKYYAENLAFLKSSELSNGLLYNNNLNRNSLCVETSAEYIRLLTLISDVEGATKKSMMLISLQNPNGSWPIINRHIPKQLQNFPSVTGFVLRSLAFAAQKPKNIIGAIKYLNSTQKNEGHWGSAWQYYGSIYYTLIPIIEAIQSYGNYNSPNFRKLKLYINKRLNSSFWLNKKDDLKNSISLELETALALQCAFLIKIHDQSIHSAVKWLLERQNSFGYWSGGYFPHPDSKIKKNENHYAIAQVLATLYFYYKNYF